MFLHLVAPDTKFLWRLRELFETVAPGMNAFVALGTPDEHFELPAGVTLAQGPDDVARVVRGQEPWDGIVLNGLSFQSWYAVASLLPPDAAIAWYVWGFEAYGHWHALASRLLMPETQRIHDRNFQSSLKNRLRPALRWRQPNPEAISRLLTRLDYCVTPLREEYDLFLAAGMPKTVGFHWGLVGTLEQTVEVDSPPGAGGEIQLGNSAGWSNNHVEAMRILSGPQTGSRKVVTPLSYGDPRCRRAVLAAGRELLGDRFHPLLGFLPLDDYHRVVQSCGHVVMNHLRQQALGNIFAALWRGARVYMNDTTAYRGLRRYGFDVRPIGEDIASPDVTTLREPTEQEALHHRALLSEHFGRERVIAETRDLLDRLAQGKKSA